MAKKAAAPKDTASGKQPSKPRSRTKDKNLPATAPSNALTPAEMADQMAVDAGAGQENVSAADLAIPFLAILQSNSPQAEKGNPARIEGAEAGDFFNTVTQELWSGEEGIDLIPCFYQKAFVEWVLREQGGGFVATHADPSILDSCHKDDKKRDILENGHQIVTTAYHYCMMVTDSGPIPVVISLSSTQLKKSRRWNSAIAGQKIKTSKGLIQAPSFSHIYRATTIPEHNDQGTWQGWNIQTKSIIDDLDVYQAAKTFYESVKSGAVKVGPPPESASENPDVPETEEF